MLTEYKKAPQVTRDRLYIDMMESVLGKSSKVIVDLEAGNNLLYLPLDKLMQRGNSNISSQPGLSPNIQDSLRNLQQSLPRRSTTTTSPDLRGNLRTRETR